MIQDTAELTTTTTNSGYVIAVYIDSLVMISIERSKTNKTRALEI